jgi:hypothetical protein
LPFREITKLIFDNAGKVNSHIGILNCHQRCFNLLRGGRAPGLRPRQGLRSQAAGSDLSIFSFAQTRNYHIGYLIGRVPSSVSGRGSEPLRMRKSLYDSVIAFSPAQG